MYATLLSAASGVVVVALSLGLLGGLALVATGTALSRLAGSVLFGAGGPRPLARGVLPRGAAPLRSGPATPAFPAPRWW